MSKSKKRVLAFFLVMVSVLAILSGCSNKQTSSNSAIGTSSLESTTSENLPTITTVQEQAETTQLSNIISINDELLSILTMTYQQITTKYQVESYSATSKIFQLKGQPWKISFQYDSADSYPYDITCQVNELFSNIPDTMTDADITAWNIVNQDGKTKFESDIYYHYFTIENSNIKINITFQSGSSDILSTDKVTVYIPKSDMD